MMNRTGNEETLSVSGKKWNLRDADPRTVLAIAQKNGLPEILARLLVIRGVDPENIDLFLNPTIKTHLPDPFHLKDMEKAVVRLGAAIESGEAVCFYGDYDVDGATSTALMLGFFRELGLSPRYYIPDRVREGYGPNIEAFRKLASEGIKVIVTLDCGTTSFEPVEAAREMGVDVIVVDHHIAEPRLPEAYAVINPNRLDETSPCRSLAAVGVSFMLLVALNQHLRRKGFFSKTHRQPDLLSMLDLVALGTVCDVMPLQGLNRAFVSQGLKVLGMRNRLGLRALCDISKLENRPTAYHLGFVLGPRINAAGRIGCADYGTSLLATKDPEEAKNLAACLNQLNEERQATEKRILMDAIDQAEIQKDLPLIIVHGEDWHPGVIGIVAGRIKERFHRPTLAISFDPGGEGKGSGRSISPVDLGSMIHAARQKGLLKAGGGHAMAAGFTVMGDMLDSFRDFMNERILALNCDLSPCVSHDGFLAPTALNGDFVENLSCLEPYGQGNPSPKFVVENMRISSASIVGGDHVRVFFKSIEGLRFKGIAFKAVGTPLGDILLNPPAQPVHILTSVKMDNWNGDGSVQLEIDDISLAGSLRMMI